MLGMSSYRAGFVPTPLNFPNRLKKVQKCTVNLCSKKFEKSLQASSPFRWISCWGWAGF